MSEKHIKRVQQLIPNIDLKVISQGAEALVFQTKTHPYSSHPYLKNSSQFIIKYRPPKPYRHPKIDAQITRTRTAGEAKFMYKLSKLGIACPALISCDLSNGIIWMENLGIDLPNGNVSSVKNWLWYLEREASESDCTGNRVKQVCFKVGQLIGRLHLADMIHGDLTTSNLILTGSEESWEPALIDFGLSSFSGLAEDKAVDLYVLERSVTSTHSVFAQSYNKWLLEGYESAHDLKQYKKFGKAKYAETFKRLEEVRLRGRKRSMLG